MLNWGQRRLNSDRELRQVQMHVITQPAGLLGRMIGRPLCFRVGSFSYLVSSNRLLQRVEVEADSLIPLCEVRKAKAAADGGTAAPPASQDAAMKPFEGYRFEERVPLTLSESSKLIRRVRGYVLDAPRYPYVEFDVEAEEADRIRGTLHLHGESHTISCAKVVDGTDLLVRCPVSMQQFGVVPFKLWLGLFSVADTVLVETRVPATALKL